MIRIISGDFGSGKTTRLSEWIARDVREGRHALLIVPEQQTVLAEQAMAGLLPSSAPLSFEVTNFSRLANTVFRLVGGLSYRYADTVTAALLMWQTMSETLPLLHEKAAEIDPGAVRRNVAAMQELSACSLTPGDLAEAAENLPADSHLRNKLEDLSLLSATYRRLLSGGAYADLTDDLTRLSDLLESTPLLRGTTVCVDGFISYTEQEYRVLQALAGTCDLLITLDLPKERADELLYTETRETRSRLQRIANKAGVPIKIDDLGGTKRARTETLRYTLQNLFRDETPTPVCCETGEKPKDSLRLVCCAEPFSAAEWIAGDIARRVRAGARYRDFTVICRDPSQYEGILDVVFTDAGIPCFFAKQTDISSYAAVKLIFAAYAVCADGWKIGDVLTFVKCGLLGFTREETDVFEEYVSRWQIDGRRFTDGIAWNMNPAGYEHELSPRGAQILSLANRVRDRLVEVLTPISESLGRRPVPDHCRTLYDLLVTLDVKNQLKERAERTRVSQDTDAAQAAAEAEALSRLFETLTDTLDRLAETLPDVTLDARAFAGLLRLALGNVSLSRIPTSVDEVTVGAADRLRSGGTAQVYLLGVNEGEFPAPVRDTGVFTEQDRRTLGALGLPVQSNVTERAARERFCFARAFASASDGVTLLYTETTMTGSATRSSPVALRVRDLGGVSVIQEKELPRVEKLYAPAVAARYLGLLYGTADGEALSRVLEEDPAYADAVRRLPIPLVEDRCRLSSETTRALTENGLFLSQSSIDRYARCPFSYFCKYVLELDTRGEIAFDRLDSGNLVHAVLEKVLSAVAAQAKDGGIDPAVLRETVDGAVEAYTAAVTRGNEPSPRLRHLFARLRRTAYFVAEDLCAELANSRFRPVFFELSMTKGKDAPGCLPLELSSGKPIRLSGRVDRVDTWHDARGQTYIRVIDYKTGDKRFTLDKIDEGEDTQLPLYLFSLQKSKNPLFKEAIGATGKILPAGVLYVGARIEPKTVHRPGDPDKEKESAVKHSVYRRGLLLNDRDVLEAQERGLAGRFLPVAVTKKGEYSKNSLKALANEADMAALEARLREAIRKIGDKIENGEADARPLRSDKRQNICKNCELKAVCRSAEL